MARLFHFPLDPLCRRIRLALAEYGRDSELVEERPWEGRAEFLDRNPAGLLPIFEDDDGTQAAGIEAVGEYLDETRAGPARSLYGTSPAERAETRRLIAWFDQKFHGEVSAPLIAEKVVRRHLPREAGDGTGAAGAGINPGPSQLYRRPGRKPQLARRKRAQCGRPGGGGASVGSGLSRRRAMGGKRRRQGLVSADQVATVVPAAPRRSDPGHLTPARLCGSRFLRRRARRHRRPSNRGSRRKRGRLAWHRPESPVSTMMRRRRGGSTASSLPISMATWHGSARLRRAGARRPLCGRKR